MKYLFIISVFIIIGCTNKRTCEQIEFSKIQLDSVKQRMDTSFSKPYRSEEFSTVDYYINKKDSSVCQVMKDKAGTIRQVIMTQKGLRFFSAEYFANGQAKVKIGFDKKGQFDGAGFYYYEDGCLKSSGNFQHGLYSGEWTNFDEKGRTVSIDLYDKNGQLVKTIPK